MTLHKKWILAFSALLLIASVWVVSANDLVDQKGVLSGRVLAQGLVGVGAFVREGDVLMLVDSIAGAVPAVRATADGKVAAVMVKPGDIVKTGDVLVRIEPIAR